MTHSKLEKWGWHAYRNMYICKCKCFIFLYEIEVNNRRIARIKHQHGALERHKIEFDGVSSYPILGCRFPSMSSSSGYPFPIDSWPYNKKNNSLNSCNQRQLVNKTSPKPLCGIATLSMFFTSHRDMNQGILLEGMSMTRGIIRPWDAARTYMVVHSSILGSCWSAEQVFKKMNQTETECNYASLCEKTFTSTWVMLLAKDMLNNPNCDVRQQWWIAQIIPICIIKKNILNHIYSYLMGVP